jgi:hypothetical protein
MDRVVLVQELRADGPDLRDGVVEAHKLAEPARPVGHDVAVEEQEQPATRHLCAQVVRGREPAVVREDDDAERHAVQAEQAARLREQCVALIGRVEHIDEVCRLDLGIVDELRELVLEEVDAAVERHDQRHVGLMGASPNCRTSEIRARAGVPWILMMAGFR